MHVRIDQSRDEKSPATVYPPGMWTGSQICAGFSDLAIQENNIRMKQRSDAFRRDQSHIFDYRALINNALRVRRGPSIQNASSSVSRLCFLRQIRHLVSPFPPVGSVAAPFGSPAVPHLHRYYGVVRLLLHPSSVAYGLPWRPSYALPSGDGELSWVHGKSLWKHALS
jgi:hypothetical protein